MNAFDLRAEAPGFRLSAAFEWESGCAALFGASGSGKTTLLEAIAGARPDVRGPIVLRGRRIDGLPARERRVGWVPQDAALFPHLTARENVAFGARARGEGGRVREAVEALEIGPLLDRRATDLSGGERQRVAIARAVASRPDFLLLDEPLASIDRPLRLRILPFLERLPAETGAPVLLVTHDPLEVLALARDVAVLEGGRVVDRGDPRSVFASAAAFGLLHALGAENRFDVRVVSRGEGTLRVVTHGGCALEAAVVPGFPEPAAVAIRAEDILLATRRPERISAQNILPGAVEALERAGGHVLARIRSGGEAWSVKVTARAAEDLELGAGSTVYLLIKAHTVHTIAPGER